MRDCTYNTVCKNCACSETEFNLVELSEHNLESSQTSGFCTDFLNHREGGMVFYQVFLLSHLQCTVAELQKL